MKNLFLILSVISLYSCSDDYVNVENNNFQTNKKGNRIIKDSIIRYDEQDIKEIAYISFPTRMCSNGSFKYSAYVAARNKSNYPRVVSTKIIDNDTKIMYASPSFIIPANENVSTMTHPILTYETLQANNIILQVTDVKIENIAQTDYTFLTNKASINNCTFVVSSDQSDPCNGLSVKECLEKYFQPGWEF